MKNRVILLTVILSILLVSCRNKDLMAVRCDEQTKEYNQWYDITYYYHNGELDDAEFLVQLESFRENFTKRFVQNFPVTEEERSIISTNKENIEIILKDINLLADSGMSDRELSNRLISEIDRSMFYIQNWYFWQELYNNAMYIFFYVLLIVTCVVIVGVLIFLNNRELKKKESELSQSRDTLKYVIKAQEDERSRISRELHDSLAQNVRYMGLLATKIDDGELSLQIQEKQQECIDEIRSLCYNFAPPDVKAGDLVSALKSLVEKFKKETGMICRLTVLAGMDFSVFNTDELMHFYRITQEALSNIQKHAKATEATILFRYEKEESGSMLYKLIISDDGCGMDERIIKTIESGTMLLKKDDGVHFGLRSIMERTALLGGTMKIESIPDDGTQITVSVRR